MPPEGFLQRWSRLKTDTTLPDPAPDGVGGHAVGAAADTAPADVAPAASNAAGGCSGQARHPTIDDVAKLGADADYSPFVARGVDQSVRRSALKKMFSDPHFNIGDGLDLYMDDYNKPDPVPAAMLAALQHSKSFFAQACPSEPGEPGALATGAPEAAVAAEPTTSAIESGHAMAGNPAATRADNEGAAS